MNRRIERVIAQPEAPGMVGDGFRVYNYIPGDSIPQQRISPFLMLDFAAEIDFAPSGHQRGVGVHPHKGFETVTIAYKGSVAHNDSAGNSGVVNPGDVQWMTAGSGILHKEYHEEAYSKKGGPFEMVQLWVNLPKKDKLTAPHYQALTKDQMGRVSLADGEVDVIAGEFDGVKGPAETYTPVELYNARIRKGGRLSMTLPAEYNTAILVVNGSVVVNGRDAAAHSFVFFANEEGDIAITAAEDAVLLVLSGEPIDEPIAAYGPFVMNTHEELVESFREMNAGKFGVLE